MPSKIYVKANDSQYRLMVAIMAEHHQELDEVGVRVALTFARKFDKEDQPVPCVRFAGGYAVAVARKVPLKRRLYVPYDAEIEVDGMRWDDLGDAEQRALLDHELEHIKLSRGQDGEVIIEDDDRPKVKLIPDDFVLTGFNCIANRHGEHALEWQSVRRVHEGLLETLRGVNIIPYILAPQAQVQAA